jgi:hypothetical protein
MIACLCLSFMENGNKHRPRRIVIYIYICRIQKEYHESKGNSTNSETSCLTV